MSKNALSTVATRHQVFLERLKSQYAVDFTTVIPQLERAIRDVVYDLQVDVIGSLSSRQLKKLLTDLVKVQQDLIAKAEAMLLGDLEGLAKYEAAFEARALEAAITAAKQRYPKLPKLGPLPAGAAYQYVLEKPVSATGTLLDPFIRTWGEKQIEGVERAVRRAWGEGRTIGQLATELRGTKAAGYKDGLMAASRRQAEAMARTSVQHTAQAARDALWEENDDLVEGVIFIATLDGKTTRICRSLDKREFPLTSGPRPPLHIGCRSTTIAKLPKEFDFLDEGATRSSMNGYVKADQSYYDWLKGQPESFQDEALGADYAKLFRKGGLSTDKFAALQLDKNFKPITLDQMARLEPSVFERAGLSSYKPK